MGDFGDLVFRLGEDDLPGALAARPGVHGIPEVPVPGGVLQDGHLDHLDVLCGERLLGRDLTGREGAGDVVDQAEVAPDLRVLQNGPVAPEPG